MNKLLVAGGVVGLVVGGALLAAGLAKVGDGNPSKLTWRDPEVKPALMTLGYKVYANPNVEFGRHYLSKIVFKNEGARPLSEFSIRYKLEGQIDWTEPEVTREIPAGFTFVKLFYPSLPSDVSKIRNATTANLHINIRWKDDKEHDETIRKLVTLRGVNELAYCDLPKNEVESWYDAFSASKFAVSMVTPNDPVVHRYTSEIMKYSGGTTAGAGGGPEEIKRLCGWVYDYMCASGLVYASATGVPSDYADISTYVQNVRLPRDVIENNQGLCIELTMLWCSILEHLGVRSALIMIPGHAFVIAYAPENGVPLAQGLPIECTAITPRAVGRDGPVSFAEAVQMASQTLAKQTQQGLIFPLPVHEIQAMGFTPPELPDKDITKLGEMLAQRTARPARNTPQVVVQPQNNFVTPNQPNPNTPGPVQPNTPNVPAGYTAWRHPQGHMSMALPPDFVQLAPPGTFQIVVLSVGNPNTSSEVDVMQVANTQSPQEALNYVAGIFGQMGARVQTASTTQGPNGVTYFNGTTMSAAGNSRWVCVAKAVPGGVVLVSAGANVNAWGTQSALLQGILSTVQFN